MGGGKHENEENKHLIGAMARRATLQHGQIVKNEQIGIDPGLVSGGGLAEDRKGDFSTHHGISGANFA